jgi:hypothetical protein
MAAIHQNQDFFKLSLNEEVILHLLAKRLKARVTNDALTTAVKS